MTRLLLLSASFLFLVPAGAQDCTIPYTQPLFGVAVQQGIVFDTVARFDGGTDTLKLDLYTPIGDGQALRPLVVMVHGGGFIGGDRSDMADACSLLASCGWAAATISYRLGFHAPAQLQPPFTYDEAEVVRAAYRGLLDTRSAVRFLQARSALDSTLTEKVVLFGVSAGGINVLHAAYGRNEALRPAASYAQPPVVLDGNTYARPDLGGLNSTGAPGDDVLAVVSYLGALIDTAMIADATTPALFMYHQTGDPVVGCGYEHGLWGAPFGIPDNYPYLFGSCMIDARAQHLGFAPERYRFIPYAGNEHDVHDLPLILNETLVFMRQQICAAPTGIEEADGAAFQVRPVPSDGTFWVELPERTAPDGMLQVLDADGRLVHTERLWNSGQRIQLPSIPNGTYLVRCIGSGGGIAQRRLVVVH